MITLKQLIYTILVGLFLFGACANPEAETKNTLPTAEALAGRWELSEAIRNGKVAPSMEGTYFDFTSDKSLTTNMMGSDATAAYTLSENTLLHTTNGLSTTYQIEKVTEDSLLLTTSIRGFAFNLALLRAKE